MHYKYQVIKKDPMNVVLLFPPSPYQTRCNTIVTSKSKRRFPETQLLSKKKPKTKPEVGNIHAHTHTHTELQGSEAGGNSDRTAALPKKTWFKGFKNFWQDVAVNRYFSSSHWALALADHVVCAQEVAPGGMRMQKPTVMEDENTNSYN